MKRKVVQKVSKQKDPAQEAYLRKRIYQSIFDDFKRDWRGFFREEAEKDKKAKNKEVSK